MRGQATQQRSIVCTFVYFKDFLDKICFQSRYTYIGGNTMEELARFITDERTGLKYELCGDYYIIAGEDEPEREPIGVWGQRHLNYLRDNKRVLLSGLQLSGKLNGYIADIDQQAEDMFFRLVKQMAEREGVIL